MFSIAVVATTVKDHMGGRGGGIIETSSIIFPAVTATDDEGREQDHPLCESA